MARHRFHLHLPDGAEPTLYVGLVTLVSLFCCLGFLACLTMVTVLATAVPGWSTPPGGARGVGRGLHHSVLTMGLVLAVLGGVRGAGCICPSTDRAQLQSARSVTTIFSLRFLLCN